MANAKTSDFCKYTVSKWVDNFANDFIISKVQINVKLCK